MHYRGPVPAFSVLLKHMDTNIAELPMDLRCELAIELARHARFNSPELFILALHCDPISPPAIYYQNEHRTTLLHAVGGALGILWKYNNTKSAYWTDIKDREKWISDWKSILQALVAGGADLHVTCQVSWLGLGYIQATPLLFMFLLRDHCTREELVQINLQYSMNLWISALSDSGVDLTKYGQRERLIWNSADILKCRHDDPRDPFSDYYFGQRRLISFDYGPSPKNWKLWENEPTDEFAGDFWLMLDRKEEIMPGTWID